MEKYIEKSGLLLDHLQELYPDSSKNTLRQWIQQGRVWINQEQAKKNCLVENGQTVSIKSKERAVQKGLTIHYEDQHIIVVEKKAGLLSVATAFEKEETVFDILKRRFRPKQVYVIHRLDRETSGILIFAKSEPAFRKLKDLFKEHDLEREYFAVVDGHPESPKGTWESYLKEDKNYFVQSVTPQKGAQRAITHYTELQRQGKHSLLRVRLETGRKNQVRVHCADAGMPIVGDSKYGYKGTFKKRLCLHATRLALKHPITGKWMSFTSPYPEAFQSLVKWVVSENSKNASK
ncbi:MAG: RNA pseudouridine synthase [Waddliaceae bacterium]|nr:RNA pseudouridine synthase [Waddliaceae bacterium]